MLCITLKTGREIGWHVGSAKPKVAVEQIEEIYVDGDEVGGLFPNMESTHGIRGGAITGDLAQLVYKGWVRNWLREIDETEAQNDDGPYTQARR